MISSFLTPLYLVTIYETSLVICTHKSMYAHVSGIMALLIVLSGTQECVFSWLHLSILLLSTEHLGIWSVFWAAVQIMGGEKKDERITCETYMQVVVPI